MSNMDDKTQAVASSLHLPVNMSSRFEELSVSCNESSEKKNSGAVKKKVLLPKPKVKKHQSNAVKQDDKVGFIEDQHLKVPLSKHSSTVHGNVDIYNQNGKDFSRKLGDVKKHASGGIMNSKTSTESLVGGVNNLSKKKIAQEKGQTNLACKGMKEKPNVLVTEEKGVDKWGVEDNIPKLSGSRDKRPRKKSKCFQRNLKFEPYIPLSEVQQGLKRGEFIEGALRVNPRNYEDAYVSAPDGQMDIYIGGMRDRNRALNGDIVVVQLKPKQEWKVLCEAIKDYQERCGHSNFDTLNRHAVFSPPCKVHTPERLNVCNPGSSSSWDCNSAERLPDTLEILGVDRLAKQFDQLSKVAKKKNRRRNRNKNKSEKENAEADSNRESESQKSSTTSFSQGSSEDHLTRSSSQHSCKGTDNVLETELHNEEKVDKCSSNIALQCHGSLNYDMNDSPSYTYDSLKNSDRLPNSNGADQCFNKSPNNSVLGESCSGMECENPWICKEKSLNLVVSPEQLLDFDDINTLQFHALKSNLEDDGSKSDGSDSECIIVPPDDLSGDDFSDTYSGASSCSHQIDQLLEDAAFLASQQDAQNNNVDDMSIINGHVVESEDIFYDSVVSTSGRVLDSISDLEHGGDNSFAVTSSYCSVSPKQSCINNENNIKNCYLNINVPITTNPIQKKCKKKSLSGIKHPSPSKTRKDSIKKKEKKKIKKKIPISQIPESRNENDSQMCMLLDKAFEFDFNSLSVDDVMQHDLWAKFVQKTGKVIFIKERKNSCITAGHIKLLPNNKKWALFSPNDNRFPRMYIFLTDCPKGFCERPSDFDNVLFLAEIVDWKEDCTFASGKLIKSLGETGEVEPETKRILYENSVDFREFPKEIVMCLPDITRWKISDEEVNKRRDFRSICVYTIDPSTARDIDDAVSCCLMTNGNYEVGVHIADVSFFVQENSLLDDIAKKRATSVYLVQEVIPMLPRLLCDDLCSLNPGKDKLTFSVVWEITPDCKIINEWFGRTLINSCIKMSYEHAQEMIENPKKTWNSFEHPDIYGGFAISDVVTSVLQLHKFAVALRHKRFLDGALRLDQTKLQFTLNAETGHPSGFSVYENKDSNRLIEEFMLLANMAVAHEIYKVYPELALLRRHPAPQTKLMEDVIDTCAAFGIHLDASSSGSLQSSLSRYFGDSIISKARGLILTHLCSKPMNCALYYCAGELDDSSLFNHYALNVPLYTHFTSPIRRYPDIIVHRLLGASLGYALLPSMKPKDLQICAEHCNDKKYSSKKVSDASAELFLAVFIRECGPLDTQGMVISVMDHSFDCLILHIGIVKRVYCDKLSLLKRQFRREKGISSLKLFWEDDVKDGLEQNIKMFSLVELSLMVMPHDTLKITAILKKPCDKSVYA